MDNLQATLNALNPGDELILQGGTYNITWRVTDIPDGGGGPNPCLRTVEVRVGWSEEEIANKTLALTTRRYNWGAASC